MTQYATVEDVYLVYGKQNVLEWANLDNDSPTEEELQPRIIAAIESASAWVENRLRGAGYIFPFEFPYDSELSRIVAAKAGVLLYLPRAAEDVDGEGNPIHKLQAYEDMAKQFTIDVRLGRIILPGRAEFTTVPRVVS